MNILMIGNRYTSNIDVIATPHYRTNVIGKELKQNANVFYYFVNYKNNKRHNKNNRQSYGLQSIPNVLEHIRSIKRTCRRKNINAIWLTNGPMVAFLSYFLIPDKQNKQIIYEVLDNYKTFFPWVLGWLNAFDSYIRKQSNLCLYVSKPLFDLDKRKGLRTQKKLFYNGADLRRFRPLSKNKCREELNLPLEKKIIGFTGSLDVRVAENLNALFNNIHDNKTIFLIAGKNAANLNLKRENIIYLGPQTSDKIPVIMNASDVLIIPNRLDDFTKYCFPSKLAEYIACESKILSTPIPALTAVLPQSCFASYDMDIFSEKLIALLNQDELNYPKSLNSLFSWNEIIKTSLYG